MREILAIEYLERRIYIIRGQKVMRDTDLALLYRVPIKRLNEQVKRNVSRFPEDFMFQLTAEEDRILRSQFATLKTGGHGKHRKYRPYVFTEQGVAMLSSVLASERAIQVNIAIMRAFVRLREMLATHKKLAFKLAALEKRIGEHDQEIKSIFDAIYELTQPRRIGFKT